MNCAKWVRSVSATGCWLKTGVEAVVTEDRVVGTLVQPVGGDHQGVLHQPEDAK